MAEFDFIHKYFHRGQTPVQVALDKGDDCALLNPTPNTSIAITTDTLVCGTHFLADISPHALGYRALATNLSDLAAMGAKPKWFNLAICLPKNLPDIENWLGEFSRGLFELADQHQIYLIGGDTTSGPLSITITAMGEVAENKSLKRTGAQVGDLICVSGYLGGAAGALQFLLGEQIAKNNQIQSCLLNYFNYPQPQVSLGKILTEYATSAIDISDGLLADLSHILKASAVGAHIQLENLPIDPALREQFGLAQAQQFAATGGDDYQLCFTLAEHQLINLKQALELFNQQSNGSNITIAVIGCVQPLDASGEPLKVTLNHKAFLISQLGFQHFA